MSELQHLAAWIKEQYPEGYLLTWLLNQPGLWWCDGEIYQAALLQDGDRLKNFVRANEENEMLQGITSKLDQEENWQALAASLTRIFEIYQQELSQLQAQRLQRERLLGKPSVGTTRPTDKHPPTDIQQPLPIPTADPLIGHG
ncbi:MAG TPA: hypothetical protein IGS17_14200 [Oscillatoriales cyanobacterium M59_W2019_021]|nr:MAG: hypothetical protein D6728_05115 [Cyanobacteria bacterium J055]HIK30451.1 hypothetical protein [Oscillatoriales cyanobacterium M4454_W2019_049]HIK52056.1 hypothetical protein [Oscillatoriales cyanobacterium M59_W2019_021]